MKTARAVAAWRRRTAMRPEQVSKRLVVGGPWEGLTVVVRANMQRSLDLVIRGQRGRFETISGRLQWVAAA